MRNRQRTAAVPSPSVTRRALALIARRLKPARVARVNVKYISEGTEVSFTFEPYTRRGKLIHAARVPDALAIEAACLQRFAELQDQRYPRWCTGAGGFGVFEWDLVRNKLNHFHHQRIVDVKTTRVVGF